MKIILVMVGGALGTLARFSVSSLAQKYVTNGFPVETLTLFKDGNTQLSILNILLNNVLGILLALFGLFAAKLIR